MDLVGHAVARQRLGEHRAGFLLFDTAGYLFTQGAEGLAGLHEMLRGHEVAGFGVKAGHGSRLRSQDAAGASEPVAPEGAAGMR